MTEDWLICSPKASWKSCGLDCFIIPVFLITAKTMVKIKLNLAAIKIYFAYFRKKDLKCTSKFRKSAYWWPAFSLVLKLLPRTAGEQR